MGEVKFGSLLTDTTQPKDGLAAALARAKKEFPLLSGLDAVVQWGDGPGYAEFYPPDEARNPNPGRYTIEIRKKGMNPDDLFQTVAGDLFHAAQNASPRFKSAKAKFIKSMHPAQIKIAREMYAETIRRDTSDTRTFPEFLDQSAADAFIRSYIFKNKGVNKFIGGFPIRGGFFEQNLESLKEMEAALLAK